MGIADEDSFTPTAIGRYNAEFIHNMTVNIVENSYGEGLIRMDSAHFEAISAAKRENYERIYHHAEVRRVFDETVRPMMEGLYERLLGDLLAGREESPIFRHHISYVNAAHYKRRTPYEATEPNQLVVDYIASMTDDYFVDLYAHLFGSERYVASYRSYRF